MGNKLSIPDTVDGVIADLDNDAALHMATGWRLAARLAAIVRLSESNAPVASSGYSTYAIAKLGIRGLTSHTTVERYVKGWLAAHDGVYPVPGETVEIPDGPFPPEDKNIGTRTPKSTALAVAQLLERDGIDDVVAAIPDDVVDRVHAALYRRLFSNRPAPEPRDTDRGAKAKVSDGGVMRAGQYLLGAQEARDDGYYVPGPEAAIMLGLFERADWDAALEGLTGRETR